MKVPGSKSYTNRALIIAALASGTSTLKDPLFSDDTNYMIEALKQLGIKIEKQPDKIIVKGGTLKPTNKEIFIGNAGTAMRMLTGLLSLIPVETTITGNKRMQQRPIQDLLDGLNQLGIVTESNSCPPVKVKGGTINKT